MRAIIIRHGKVDFQWCKWSTSEQFIEMIIQKDNNCIIVTHGFFMHTLLSQTKKQAFQISHTRLSYSNGECVIAEH